MRVMRMRGADIKTAAVIYRARTPPARRKALEVQKFLKSRGVKSFAVSDRQTDRADPGAARLIVSLGGDGAYLKAVHFAENKSIPVLGINMGSFGFLTPHNEARALEILDKCLDGKMFLRRNFFLQAEIVKDTDGAAGDRKIAGRRNAAPGDGKRGGKTFQAVNDIVVERGRLSRLISLSVFINNQYICSVKADGLIVAGPLGSTAYNLAAGGPILHPEVRSFVITPICSHSLTNRPVIIHDKSEIKIRADSPKAFLTIDGAAASPLTNRDTLLVRKDRRSFLSLTEKRQWEFELLREKLQFGQRN